MKREDIKVSVKFGEVLDASGAGSWDYICEKYGLNPWCINEGRADRDDTIEISLADAEYIGITENEQPYITEKLDISPNGKMVYLLSSDGHRDSANLQKCAVDEAGLKKLLIEDTSHIFGGSIVENSIRIDYEKEKIYFEYKDSDGFVDDSRWGFITVNIV